MEKIKQKILTSLTLVKKDIIMKKKCCGQITNFLHFFLMFFKHLDSDCSIKLKLTIDTFSYSSLFCGYSGFFFKPFFSFEANFPK